MSGMVRISPHAGNYAAWETANEIACPEIVRISTVLMRA